MEKDSQSSPHPQDIENDPEPRDGTKQPWKEPNQEAQDPNSKTPKPDLDKWAATKK